MEVLVHQQIMEMMMRRSDGEVFGNGKCSKRKKEGRSGRNGRCYERKKRERKHKKKEKMRKEKRAALKKKETEEAEKLVEVEKNQKRKEKRRKSFTRSVSQDVSAPEFRDLDDSFSSRHKILTNPLTSQKQSTSLLHRIVATLYKRFAMTGELEAIGWSFPHTPLQYDTNKESPTKSISEVSFIQQTLLIDFLQLIQEESRVEDEDLFEKDEESIEGDNSNVGAADLNDFDRFKTLDYLTFLKRLKLETNYYRFPTSKVRLGPFINYNNYI